MTFVMLSIYIMVIALAFWQWKREILWKLASSLLLLPLFAFSFWYSDTHGITIQDPGDLVGIVGMWANLLVPVLMVVTAARLVDVRHPQTGRVSWLRAALALVFFPLLLTLVGLQIMLASIWDIATDGLVGGFLVFVVNISVLGSGALLAWFLPRWWKLASIGFIVVAMAAASWGNYFGTYVPYGKWGQLPHIMTEARAKMINEALQRYHTTTGSYPAALADLTPRYLVYLPTPYIIPGQTWCYESGADYYRLGYINRDYFSSPQEVTIFASGGVMPEPDFICP